jgi:hypothetical protein
MKKYQFLYSATLNETIPKFMLLFLMTIPPILKKKKNHISPRIVSYKKRPRQIQVMAWGQVQKCSGVKPVNGIPNSPLLIMGSLIAPS